MRAEAAGEGAGSLAPSQQSFDADAAAALRLFVTPAGYLLMPVARMDGFVGGGEPILPVTGGSRPGRSLLSFRLEETLLVSQGNHP